MEGNTYYWRNEVSLRNELKETELCQVERFDQMLTIIECFNVELKIIAVALEHFYYSN